MTECPCCQRHELAQRRMLDEVNALRKQLQMQPFENICESFFARSPTAVCPSARIASSRPEVMPSRRMLESMPPEVLDRIASFVSGDDIVQLCHAVRYFKYISKAMYDFALRLQIRTPPRPADLWPRMCMESFLLLISEPPILRALGTYSRILSKHGGCASFDYHGAMSNDFGAFPESLEVSIHGAKDLPCLDDFFSVICSAKKNIRKLTLGAFYLEYCSSDPAALKMTAKWLPKLRVHELEFVSFCPISTPILRMLHLAPMLGSLHLMNLEACSGVPFSECKSLKKLVFSGMFQGDGSAEKLVQKLIDIVKESRIQQLEVYLPYHWQGFLRSDLKDIVAAVFLRNGWPEQRHVVVLISGNGSNLQALIDAQNTPALPNTKIVLVVSNRASAFGLTRASQAGIPTLTMSLKAHKDAGKTRSEYDVDLATAILTKFQQIVGGVPDAVPDLVVLAGFMHIVSPEFLMRFPPGGLVNLHPALPGEFDGAHAIDRAFAAFGEGKITRTGVMVHRVIAEVDRGEVLLTEEIPILPTDTLSTLEDRIHAIEHGIIVRGAKLALGV
ncbi:hypothetical protein CcCBS67573_g04169 [Chytriomyces confervae]|uniref:phosphoribosylglycinamide formyltransferase 1 n=1 Tax=Chytriomyces confervae TaxID=246404 RepID=A0A507FGV3_9FUNG|nr:hypothetical protein HDU80_008212 [Chytriomyces hyalinus]TPX74568.1 hypothetical protein CcCBS67573_g04169 [Chytriomyces confervae]